MTEHTEMLLLGANTVENEKKKLIGCMRTSSPSVYTKTWYRDWLMQRRGAVIKNIKYINVLFEC